MQVCQCGTEEVVYITSARHLHLSFALEGQAFCRVIIIFNLNQLHYFSFWSSFIQHYALNSNLCMFVFTHFWQFFCRNIDTKKCPFRYCPIVHPCFCHFVCCNRSLLSPEDGWIGGIFAFDLRNCVRVRETLAGNRWGPGWGIKSHLSADTVIILSTMLELHCGYFIVFHSLHLYCV